MSSTGKRTVKHSKTQKKKGNTNSSVPSAKRFRGWCWTLNNYTEEEEIRLKKLCTVSTVEKFIMGKERGSQTGTPHLQGYIYYKYAKEMADVKRHISDRAHLEAAKGGFVSQVKYCTKEGCFIQKGLDKYLKELQDEEAFLQGKEPKKDDMYWKYQDMLDELYEAWKADRQWVDEVYDPKWEQQLETIYDSD